MEEMKQLLSMGFSNDLAAQALAATGGKSTLKATEWILSHKHSSSSTSSSPPNPNHSPVQPKLDRFFHCHSKPSNSIIKQQQNDSPLIEEEQSASAVLTKRPKLAVDGQSTTNNHHVHVHVPPHQPLSERMRPRTVNDVVGQDHLLSSASILRSSIDRNRLPSIVLWGPPGTGKTSIAKAIVASKELQSSYRFVALSAVTCGVKDVRDAVDVASKTRKLIGKKTVLFLDEVHRFNKSQQDSFLPVIEDGSIVFIGATTENPSFHLITPLLSRCRVLTLNSLKPQHVETLLKRAVDDVEKGLAKSVGMKVSVNDEVIQFLSANCDGDARVALNALEISATAADARLNEKNVFASLNAVIVTVDDAKEALQCKHLAYDKAGEEHYNLISALHKSMRGSDANAAIYWLARMLEGGEQPLYIARRLIRFASEDVGLADPLALNQAVACYQACHFLGVPECNVILAQCAAYLALAPKSVSVYRAIVAAEKAIRESVGQNEGVPLHLRNAPTKLMKDLGYGKEYIYTPDNPSATQSFLPPSLQGYKFLDWPNAGTVDDLMENNR